MTWEEIKASLASVTIGSLSLLPIVMAIVLFLVCLIAIKIIMRVINKVLEHSRIEPALKSFFHSIVKVGLWIIASIIIADQLKIETAPFVAALSVAGLALSLSIQNILSNLFSGFTIMTTRPFAAGDFVEVDNVSGVVSAVSLFYTNVKTIDNKLIYIPNGQITSAKIINYSSESQRRVDLYFEASYDDPTEKVKSAIMQAINADGRILKEPVPFVGLAEYKDSSIRYILRVWVNKADFWDVYYSLNESVREKFDENGVMMTYAHLNVHMVEK